MSLRESSDVAVSGARGAAVILSANPIHDTGGGQRSAQIALELLAREWAVLFVSHGEVTETRDLGLNYPFPRLVSVQLKTVTSRDGVAALDRFFEHPEAMIVTQVPVARWLPALARGRRAGAVCVYDLIDRWDSELGFGWYRRKNERRVAEASDVLVASAPVLARHLETLCQRPVHLLPNAFNGRLFQADRPHLRPEDLPADSPVVLYVGALWGGWMDWGLVDGLARALPNVAFVFVGDHRKEGRRLPGNCHFLGLKRQTDLPSYLAHVQVGFLPWMADEVTQATSPLKVYEYLAMGLPVVAPDLDPLRGMPGVTRCRTVEDFVAAVTDALSPGVRPDVRAAMAGFSRENSWGHRVDRLLEFAEAGPRAPPASRWVALRRSVGL